MRIFVTPDCEPFSVVYRVTRRLRFVSATEGTRVEVEGGGTVVPSVTNVEPGSLLFADNERPWMWGFTLETVD